MFYSRSLTYSTFKILKKAKNLLLTPDDVSVKIKNYYSHKKKE